MRQRTKNAPAQFIDTSGKMKEGETLSVKITVSTTQENECEEVLKALHTLISKKDLRVKKKPPIITGKEHYIAYVETRKHYCI